MDGWKGWVGARCGFPMRPQLGKSDESFDVVNWCHPHRPAYLIHTAAHLRMHVHFLHHTCTCTCLDLHLRLGLPAVSPVAPTPTPRTQRPPSRQPRRLLHCLPVHSRLQHCIFPDPHLSPASASSSRNGNASARGRRNPFLLSVSALALTVFLSAAWNIPLCAAVCSLHPSALCHVMPCHAMLCRAASIYSTVHTHTHMSTYIDRVL